MAQLWPPTGSLDTASPRLYRAGCSGLLRCTETLTCPPQLIQGWGWAGPRNSVLAPRDVHGTVESPGPGDPLWRRVGEWKGENGPTPPVHTHLPALGIFLGMGGPGSETSESWWINTPPTCGQDNPPGMHSLSRPPHCIVMLSAAPPDDAHPLAPRPVFLFASEKPQLRQSQAGLPVCTSP